MWALYHALSDARDPNDPQRLCSDAYRTLPSRRAYPSYYRVIGRPVSLGCVEAKLRARRYASVEGVAADLRLMLHNALAFNEEGSQIARDAATMLHVLDAHLAAGAAPAVAALPGASRSAQPQPQPQPQTQPQPQPQPQPQSQPQPQPPQRCLCLQCQAAASRAHPRGGRRSGATLIICPAAILQQWRDEIARHVDPAAGLRVAEYPGVAACAVKVRKRRRGWRQAARLLNPAELAKHDIVLTTYGDPAHPVLAWDPLGRPACRPTMRAVLPCLPCLPCPACQRASVPASRPRPSGGTCVPGASLARRLRLCCLAARTACFHLSRPAPSTLRPSVPLLCPHPPPPLPPASATP